MLYQSFCLLERFGECARRSAVLAVGALGAAGELTRGCGCRQMEHVLRHATDDPDIVLCDAIDSRFRLWSRLGSGTQLQVMLLDLTGLQQYKGRLPDENGKVMQSLSVLNSDTVRVFLSYGAQDGPRLNPVSGY